MDEQNRMVCLDCNVIDAYGMVMGAVCFWGVAGVSEALFEGIFR